MSDRRPRGWRRGAPLPSARRPLAGLVLLAVTVVAAGCGSSAEAVRASVPTAEVVTGEFVDHLTLQGTIEPVQALHLNAPPRAGDLQIVNLVPNGSRVEAGDVVVEFDVSTVSRTLEERQSELRQARAEIDRARAQGSIREEASLTTHVNADYNVERARLEVEANDVRSRVEADQNKLRLADAEQQFTEAEVTLEADKRTTEADVRAAAQRQEKVDADLALARNTLGALTLRAPADGIVAIQPNYRAASPGGSPPPFRPGDRAWPGATIATLPDLSEVTVLARIDENDRSRLSRGLAATITVEALPGVELPATVTRISALAKPDFTHGWPPPRRFDVTLLLEEVDSRLRPGMTASARLAIDRAPDSLLVPAEALFARDGLPIVYVETPRGFVAREVEVAHRGQESIALGAGVSAGERVALRAPDGQR